MNPLEPSEAARFRQLEADYDILGELGRGGTSVVYRARERALGRDVAIKVVRSTHLDNTEVVARLAREARLVAALRHPNIVPLLSVRHLSDGLALIMQHVPGRTLKRAIREQGPLPAATVEHVLREIGAALEYAHKRHGIVHRDIKPENIYLDEDVGRILLSDFGIARSTEGDSTLTLVGTALGTPAYMSPEQIDGIALDGRSDLYSLGLVAHEMLTGRQPWAGHNLYTIIYKQKHEELPPVSQFRNDVPPYLLHAVDDLLRKDAAERCPDAAHLLAQLSSTPLPTMSFAAPAEREVPVALVGDDAPTVRYQRPAPLAEAAPPAPADAEPLRAEPAGEPAPAIAAAASAPAPMEVTREVVSPVLFIPEQPGAQPVLRYGSLPRGRGGLVQPNPPEPESALAAALAWAPSPPPAVALATTHEDDDTEDPTATLDTGKTRMIAGLTFLLMLSATATVVAMMNVGQPSTNDLAVDSASMQVQPSENAEAALLKSSGREFGSVSAGVPATRRDGNRTTEARTEQPRTEKPRTEKPRTEKPRTGKPDRAARNDNKAASRADAPPVVPNLSLPTLAASPIEQPLSAADFTSTDLLSRPRADAVSTTRREAAASNTPGFAARTVEPRLKNRAAVQRALTENYPPMLRERGVSGTVSLWVLVDSTGRVQRSEIHASSGNALLDRAATRVVNVMQFAPAVKHDRNVSLWIQLPIQFKAN
jgi:TonB family protein